MNRNKALPLLLIVITLAGSTWFIASNKLIDKFFFEDDPDMSPTGVEMAHDEYLMKRIEYFNTLQGFDTAKPDSREKSVRDMERSEATLKARLRAAEQPEAAAWVPIGPAPIPVNASVSYSGRTVAIAVHPTNPNIVYAGAAQGGLYRSLDGGATWVPLMDSALTLAIGAIAISPADPTTIYVGTGESGLCGSGCYIGVGLYKITNADTAPVLSAVINKNTAGSDVFSGRAVSEIVFDPGNANTVYAATTSGVAGIGATTTGLSLPNAGLYRSTNALSADPRFDQVAITGALSSRSVIDLAIDPGDGNRLVLGLIGNGGDGGVYVTTNAQNAAPTFTRPVTNGDGSSLGRTELALNRSGGVVTVYAATGTANGTLLKSIDGGATFNPTAAATGFCSSQCFYDLAVAVDPTDANKVYLGGSPTLPFGKSANGATTAMTSASTNLHVDTQAITVAPSNPAIVYFGSDGGIWRTNDVNAASVVWNSLNNSTYSATQFVGLSTHAVDRNFSLGGTQDNGTQFLSSNGTTWVRSDGGDGGFSVIDQTSLASTNVTAYHTYFNSSGTQIGFSRATTSDGTGDPNWGGLFGCGGTANGIICADAVLFYAPMVGGPSAAGSVGNSLYFGTTRLYRSINQGTTMTDVSGVLSARISAIAIGQGPAAAPNDDVRLVGTTAGGVFLSTTAGSTTMTNVTGSIPARYVGRVAIDPTNSNVAYVCLNGFGVAAGQHVWKTTNLLSGAPTWTAAGLGIPDTPINAFAVDPSNPNTLFAGSDIGVFKSSDGGANWIPFSNGLPRVAVFGMSIQQSNRILRIATHGRGMYDYNLNVPATKAPFDFDGDNKTDLSIFRPGPGEWWYNRSSNGSNGAVAFGNSTDKITPGDYTGDGKTDVAIFRPSNGNWFVLRSEDFSFYAFPFGTTGDVPAPADYDGDGKADAAVFRPSTNTWYISKSAGGTDIVGFGIAGDKAVAGDYDGDGKADIAIFRNNAGVAEWWIRRSSNGSVFAVQFGAGTDNAVQGDYTGDGKTDIAIWRPSNGNWFILRSEDFSFYAFPFGTTGDVPVPGDYDGDGKFDAGVFRPTGSQWFVQRSTAGTLIQAFGISGDLPVPNAYVR